MNESRHTPLRRVAGFTLVEAVVTIVITGILVAIVARFITVPVSGYLDSARRAELTDAADASLRRISRDVHMALPNTLREPSAAPPAGQGCIEFIPVIGVGRYRHAKDSSGNGNIFGTSTAGIFSFDALVADGITAATIGSVVVNNLGTVGLDAYQTPSANKRAINSVSALTITHAGPIFTIASPSFNFQVIPNYSVTYSCPGDGNLYRLTGAIAAAAPASCPTPTTVGYAGTALVSNVTSCSLQQFSYTVRTVPHRLLKMTLEIADPATPGEKIRLFNEVYVNNAP